MSTSKYFDRICCVFLALTLLITAFMMNAEAFGIGAKSRKMGYEDKLFDKDRVHTIDIIMDDFEGFIETCTNEEYVVCSVVIDGEAYKNVALRAKGNTSLSNVSSYGNDRYSFKIEFDHYDSTKSYHGLDKLSLNNIIQDNTYMKDYLTYTMMGDFGAASPLCSYAYITVNGEDFGLYLAVEAVEDSFLQRNYGSDYGALYKPDSMSFGGGRGNGKDFDFSQFMNSDNASESNNEKKINVKTKFTSAESDPNSGNDKRQNNPFGGNMNFGENMNFGGMGFGGMGSDDVKLKYIDDNPESYSNIFGNAKTDIGESDQKRLISSLKALSEGDKIEDVVDIEAVIRYFVVHNFVCNGDSYTGSMIHNYYLYEEDGVLSMLPWDYNLAFGGFTSGEATSLVNTPINSPVSGGIGEDRPMISWIFQNEEYQALYEEYFSEFISEYFESGYFSDMVDKVYEIIAPYVEKDPTKFCTYEEFEKGFATLKEFCILRAESVRGQLDGSIGSTSSEQQSREGFVDASHITVSDMGSMGGFGGGKGGFGGERPAQNKENQSENNSASQASVSLLSAAMPQMPEGFGGQMPEGFSGQMPEGFGGQTPEGEAVETSENSSQNQAPSKGQNGFSGEMNFPGGNMGQMPSDFGGSTAPSASSSNNIWLLVISFAVLVLGLIFAFAFKGRML